MIAQGAIETLDAMESRDEITQARFQALAKTHSTFRELGRGEPSEYVFGGRPVTKKIHFGSPRSCEYTWWAAC